MADLAWGISPGFFLPYTGNVFYMNHFFLARIKWSPNKTPESEYILSANSSENKVKQGQISKILLRGSIAVLLWKLDIYSHMKF